MSLYPSNLSARSIVINEFATSTHEAASASCLMVRFPHISMVTHSTSAWASDSMLSRSRLVVGSSRARMPQFRQKVSASARRMIRDASTWTHAGVSDWKTAVQCRVCALRQIDYAAPSDQHCSDLSCLKRCLPWPWPPCSCRSCV